jgi:site-specific DNA-methyltransferase (adenine-specific)
LRMSNIKNYKYDWVWKKENWTWFLNAKKQPLRNNEQISIFYKKQPTYNPQMRTWFKPYTCKSWKQTQNYWNQVQVITENNGDRYPLNTLNFTRDKDKKHPTQKPVALMEYLIKTYTNEWELILDFTAGSGSTLLAAKNTNRNYIWIEKEEKYIDIIKERLTF